MKAIGIKKRSLFKDRLSIIIEEYCKLQKKEETW